MKLKAEHRMVQIGMTLAALGATGFAGTVLFSLATGWNPDRAPAILVASMALGFGGFLVALWGGIIAFWRA